MSDNTYIRMLIESQEKKLVLLDEAIELDEEQIRLVQEEDPNMDILDESLERKGKIVEELDRLDDGFESVYAKVREELLNNKEAHRDEIKRLQELITLITEKSVKVQAAELRGKETVERFLKRKRTALRESKSTVKAANAYAVNMRKMNKIDAFFVDKKK
ncbi:MAG: flagellar protein FliT [Lachnospiraceae bacterium]|nr:flagellar protein FliT [Lachnospiraceae bacterium]